MGDDVVPAGDRQRCPCVALLAATLIAAPRLRLLAARLRHGVAGGAWSLRVSYGRYVVAMHENIPHADANSAPSVPKEATRRHKTYAENGKSRMVDHLLLSTAKASVTDLDHHMVVWIDWTRFRRTSRSQIRGRRHRHCRIVSTYEYTTRKKHLSPKFIVTTSSYGRRLPGWFLATSQATGSSGAG